MPSPVYAQGMMAENAGDNPAAVRQLTSTMRPPVNPTGSFFVSQHITSGERGRLDSELTDMITRPSPVEV
jgi:hypothetical protein